MRNSHKAIPLLGIFFCLPASAHAGFADRMIQSHVNQTAVFSVVLTCQVLLFLAVCFILKNTRPIVAVKDWCKGVSGKWYGVFVFAVLLAFVCVPYFEFSCNWLWFFIFLPMGLGYLVFVLCMLSHLRVSWKLLYGPILLLAGQVAGYIVYLAIHGFKFFQYIFKYVEGGEDGVPILMECLPKSSAIVDHLKAIGPFSLALVAPVLLFTIIHQVYVWRKSMKQNSQLAKEPTD